ncbi:MAG: ABC transporter permease, partial [Bauldia litoralis]
MNSGATAADAGKASEIPHYVSREPFDPRAIEKLTPEQEKVFLASQKKLMWWKFKRHRVAVWCGLFLAIVYASVLISEFLAPYALETRNAKYIYAPPQSIHLFHEGEFVGPFVYGYKQTLDLKTLKRNYTDDKNDVQPLRFFCRGDEYAFWGLFTADLHLVCPAENGGFFPLGADRLGRDVLSRMIYGARISLTIGLIGVAVSFLLGIVIGGLAGYYGGWVDLVVQRMIEVIQSLPTLPLWLALAAIMPVTWSPILVYFGITIILGLLDWTGLARAVRSKLLALREEDFAMAAHLRGAK